MPGFVKIGYTRRSPNTRSVELFTGYKNDTATGVPLPFDLVKSWELPSEHIEKIESQIHSYLGVHRVKSYHGKPAKEFFRLHPDKAIESIENGLIHFGWIAPTSVANQKPKDKDTWDSVLSRFQVDVAGHKQEIPKGAAVDSPSPRIHIDASASNHSGRTNEEKKDISCPVCLSQLEIPSKFSMPGKIIRCPVCKTTFDYARVSSFGSSNSPKTISIASSNLPQNNPPKQEPIPIEKTIILPYNGIKLNNVISVAEIIIAAIFLLSVVSMCTDKTTGENRSISMQAPQSPPPTNLAVDQKTTKEITHEQKSTPSNEIKQISTKDSSSSNKRSKRIYAIHPDADSIISSDHFRRWVADDQNRIRIMNNGSGAEFITLLNVYKTEIGR